MAASAAARTGEVTRLATALDRAHFLTTLPGS